MPAAFTKTLPARSILIRNSNTFLDIECIKVLEDKTYAIDTPKRQCRLKERLYELE